MPIHAYIYINSRKIEELHIGRASGDTDPDSNNSYLAVVGDRPLFIEEWKTRGTPFNHRYGDGALKCIERAIQSLDKEEE